MLYNPTQPSTSFARSIQDCVRTQDDAAAAPSGPLYLPDAAGVLAPTTALFFNDAPWLEDTGARLVHVSVSNDVAEALHVQSLRFHHEVR